MRPAKSNRVATAFTGFPTRNEPQFVRARTMRIGAILRLKKKWMRFIACTTVHEGSLHPGGAARPRCNPRLHQPR